jgi:CspA family cold shock protein
MPTGTVKFFNTRKNYGFIVNHETDEDIFVHVSGLIDDIQEDDKVTFEVEEGDRGPIAVDVELSDEGELPPEEK